MDSLNLFSNTPMVDSPHIADKNELITFSGMQIACIFVSHKPTLFDVGLSFEKYR